MRYAVLLILLVAACSSGGTDPAPMLGAFRIEPQSGCYVGLFVADRMTIMEDFDFSSMVCAGDTFDTPPMFPPGVYLVASRRPDGNHVEMVVTLDGPLVVVAPP